MRSLSYYKFICWYENKLKVRILSSTKEDNFSLTYCMLVFRKCREFFPFSIIPEGFPVCLTFCFILKAGHIHQVGHTAAADHLSIKHSIEVKSFKKRYLTAFIEHFYFSLI